MIKSPVDAICLACQLAALIRETSYDLDAATAPRLKGQMVDYSTFYTLTMLEAAQKACDQLEVPKLAYIVELLLSARWNETLAWCEQQVATSKVSTL